MNTRNLFLLMSIISLSLPIFAMDGNSEKTEVTETCALTLKNINYDGAAIYYFCKGVFSEMSKKIKAGEGATEKPSDILRFIFSSGDVAAAVKPRFMTAEEYFDAIVDPKLQELDRIFLERYEQSKDKPATWRGLKGYFKEHIIANPLVDLKKKLVAEDQEHLKLARGGIFSHGSTVIIDPSQAKK